MNLSGVCKVNVGPTGGETFTVTCFACGMPSSKEWAQRVRSRPHRGYEGQDEPYYPVLADMAPPPCGAVIMEDGSVYLCAFCHALLEAQWNDYDAKGPDAAPPGERKYNVHKFICAVCAVETYRKRVRALPFQEFPFLVKQRQSGSITLGNNPLAVVCLDCSETLWAQSAEYDRWGLPIHKRHFNWMARPPPPEDSVEATVARLPSGETQLPRCPPTDPLVPPKTNEPTALPEAIPPIKSSKPKTGSVLSGHTSVSHSGHSSVRHQQQQHMHSNISNHPEVATVHNPSGRKNSLGGMASPSLDMGLGGHQPPVVTVAPMSTQHTLTNVRKDSMSMDRPSYQHQQQANMPSSHHQNKYDSMTLTQRGTGSLSSSTHGVNLSGQHPQLFHQTPLFSPSGSYPFPWPSSITREGHSGGSGAADLTNPFSLYGGTSLSDSLPNPPTWPWIPPTSPELLRYQSYISSLQNRRLSEAYFGSGGGSLYPATTSTATYLLPLQLQGRGATTRSPSPPSHIQNQLPHSSTSSAAVTIHNLDSLQQQQQYSSSFHEIEQSILSGGSADHHHRSRTYSNSSDSSKSSSNIHHRSHTPKASNKSCSHEESTSIRIGHGDSPKRDSSPEQRSHTHTKVKKSVNNPIPSSSSTSKRKISFSKSSDPSSHSLTSSRERKKSDVLLPKKRHWQPPPSDNPSAAESSCNSEGAHRRSSTLLDKKRKFSLNVLSETSRPMDFTLRRNHPLTDSNESLSSSSVNVKDSGDETISKKKDSSSTTSTAMDLTVSSSSTSIPSPIRSRTLSCPSSSSKFSIAFLSKSESVSPSVSEDNQETSASERSSVIVTSQSQDESENDMKKSLGLESEVNAFTVPTTETSSSDTGELLATAAARTLQESEYAEQAKDHETDQIHDESEITRSTKEKDPKECLDEKETKIDENCDTNEDNIEEIALQLNEARKKEEIREVHMVRIGDLRIEPQDYVRKTIENYVSEGKQMEKSRKEKLNKQLSFLSNLGLITPEKKLEIEIETLAGRSEKYTLPPLRMRVKSPPPPKLDEVLEQQLLEVAFNDPSLRNHTTEPEKSGFLKNLGLKPASKSEKSRREVEWRLVLTERLMREKRDGRLRGVKRPWDTYDKVSKLLCLPIRAGKIKSNSSSECLSTLTLTLPPQEMETNGPRRNSSDLLTTVEAQATQTLMIETFSDPTEQHSSNLPATATSAVLSKAGVCINYPKYIPSYVLTTQSKEEEISDKVTDELTDETKSLEILNVPSLSANSLIGVGTTAAFGCGNEPILRIPVLNNNFASSRRRSSNSTIRTTTDDSDADLTQIDELLARRTRVEGLEGIVKEEKLTGESTSFQSPSNLNKKTALGTKKASGPPDWQEVDGILKASAAQWEKTKKVMEKVLSQTNYTNSKENKKALEEKASHFRAIRKHLKCQQADMRQTEKLFKGKEKQVMKKLRTLTKYSNSKDSPTNNNPS